MTAPDSPFHERHQARILAMQALYEADVAQHDAAAALAHLIDEEAALPATAAFARHLVGGVGAHLAEIDRLIAAAAPAWPLAQMAKIDKSILRVAIFEVLMEPDVPYKAAINEAVEIAKAFGSDSSSRFVNGVLGTIVAKHRPGHGRAENEGSPDAALSPDGQR